MKRSFSILLAVLLLFSGCSFAKQSIKTDGPAAPSGEEASVSSTEETTVEQTTLPPEPTVSHLMAAGDIMSHMPLVYDAYISATDTYDYSHMFTHVKEQLKNADFAIANLETVLGGGPNYSGFPNFNSPDALAYAVKDAGFKLVSTANNHTKDQGIDGVYRTLYALDKAGLMHVGSYRSEEERNENSGIVVADVGGISVAFLCYTYGLNGYRLSEDQKFAVNIFNLDYYTTLLDFDYDTVDADMAAARALNTDLIAFIIHWGVEYQNAPNSYQKQIAAHLFEQGADIIFGGHPHVLQPYESVEVTDINGNQKQGFVIYSMGNFISNQQEEPATKTTVVLDLELTKDPLSGKTEITDISYVPYFMLHRDDLPTGQRRTLVNIHKAMAEYQSGTSKNINASAYSSLQRALEHCHSILGSDGDKAN
ncbi:MAG: CapA family protein [Oscillospiraceae bacterium]|nr:CapA family protein [Oscillospiraceae bacterium]